MELWFTEEWLPGLKISVKVKNIVYEKKTKYQKLVIFDTVEFGRMLVLDNIIQTTEKDEYIYHESLVHVPMFAHPNPEEVLVIGGGDGGGLREVLRHPMVKKATLVDIDEGVIEASNQFLPGWNSSFSDPRANIVIGDGLKYVESVKAAYDVIIVDSTDPIGPGEALFRPSFYSSIAAALKPGGIMVAQTESPIAEPALVKEIYGRIAKVFPYAKIYTAPMPSYPGGWWSFTCGAAQSDPSVAVREPDPSWKLRFYSPSMHDRMFVLSPQTMEDLGIFHGGYLID